jgi:serine/threonine protein kinase
MQEEHFNGKEPGSSAPSFGNTFIFQIFLPCLTSCKSSSTSQFADWQVGTNYECQKFIGTGSYGKMALAIQKSTERKVAIKRMENIFEDETD